MNIKIDKKVLIEKLLQLTQIKESEIGKASKDAQDRANEAEGAMQSRYDTFKEEGQNLAGGLKIRHEELKASVNILNFPIPFFIPSLTAPPFPVFFPNLKYLQPNVLAMSAVSPLSSLPSSTTITSKLTSSSSR